jgi:phosphohistidine swiveling domain-containing protein
METDLQKYAERKMPFFNLVVSIWQHNLVLLNTIGVGFTKSVFTHSNGTCDLYASQKETIDISNTVIKSSKRKDTNFKVWYEKAKVFNKEADALLAKYQSGNIELSSNSYQEARRVFIDNFGFCTILPYWVLYGINQALEKGESKESFGDVLTMYEELKSETRYPQLVQGVVSRYFNKAAEILNISPELATCIHPDELGRIIAGENVVSKEELEKRMKWCAITKGVSSYEVNYIYDKESLSKILSSDVDQNVSELKGNIAFKGAVKARAKIVNAIDDMKKFEDGDILVSIQSSPALMPAIIKCSAIVTDEGGIMCHASVISRELKKPCIIGTKIATKVIKDGDLIEVDAEKGVVRILR